MIKKVVWLVLLALLIISGCKKPDSSIGLENLPDSDFFTIVVDTLTVELNTIRKNQHAGKKIFLGSVTINNTRLIDNIEF